MRKALQNTLLLSVPLLVALAAGCEDSGGLAIAGKAGTLGLGAELATAVASDINARVGFNAADVDFDGDISDIDYDFGLDFDLIEMVKI